MTEGVVKHCSVRQGMRTPDQVHITERILKVTYKPNLALVVAVGMATVINTTVNVFGTFRTSYDCTDIDLNVTVNSEMI